MKYGWQVSDGHRRFVCKGDDANGNVCNGIEWALVRPEGPGSIVVKCLACGQTGLVLSVLRKAGRE